MTSFIYQNSRERCSVYILNDKIYHPLKLSFDRENPSYNTRDRPPSLAGRVIPKNVGNTFWGRVNAFDHKAVRGMLKKEPLLINCYYHDITPLTYLFCCNMSDNIVINDNSVEYNEKHISRLNKMVRILIKHGAVLESNVLLPYFERYPFQNEIFARRTFNLLLHKGLSVDNYVLLDENEIMLLEERKYLRRENYVFWGRKIISDCLRLKSRTLYHVYLRDIIKTKPQLNYDVIGVITSFL